MKMYSAMKAKMALAALITITAGVYASTRTKNLLPADLRDAPNSNSVFEQLGYGNSNDAAVSVPEPSLLGPSLDKSGKAIRDSGRLLFKLKTEDGGDAELIGDLSMNAPYLVGFYSLHVRINGTKYRIGSGSDYLKELCKPYVKQYPYTYERVETKGFLERVVLISGGRTKVSSGNNVVIIYGTCQRDQY